MVLESIPNTQKRKKQPKMSEIYENTIDQTKDDEIQECIESKQ